MRYTRLAKALVATVVATIGSHLTLNVGLAWARTQESESPNGWSGMFEFGATLLASWTLMPLVMWAGMRLLRERRTYILISVGTLLWCGVSGYFVDNVDRPGGSIPIPALALFVIVSTLLGAIDPRTKNDRLAQRRTRDF